MLFEDRKSRPVQTSLRPGRFIPFTYFLIYSATVRQRQTCTHTQTAPRTSGAARFLYIKDHVKPTTIDMDLYEDEKESC